MASGFKPGHMARFIAGALILLGLFASAASADEVRAFWIDAWGSGYMTQSQVDSLLGPVGTSTLGEIRDANCNTVVIQVRRRADVCYKSILGEPYMSGLTPSSFDALKAVVDAAHDTTGGKARVDVYAWFVSLPTGTGTVYDLHNDPADWANYWMSRNSAGAENADATNYDDYGFDPGHPRAEEYLTNSMLDVVCNYDVDGIQFDRIRYMGPDWGYNPTNVARYHDVYGGTGNPPYTDDTWEQWRRNQLTNLIRRVYAKSIAAKPNIKVSSAVVTWTPSPASSTRAAFQATRPYYESFQDWDAWMQEGLLDIVMPMDYYSSVTSNYTNWMNFIKDRQFNRQGLVGPGIYLSTLTNSIALIQATRNGSPSTHYGVGWCGYSYRQTSTDSTWASFKSSLKASVTPTAAAIPAMPWKTSPTLGHIMGTVTYASTGDWADYAIVSVTGPTSRSMVCDGTGFYAFIDLPLGTYTVTASRGGYSDISASVNVAAGAMTQRNFGLGSTDVSNPTTPGSFSAVATSPTRASLSWSTSTDNVGVTGYNIYRNHYKIASTSSLSYVDTTCTASTTYTYQVSACDAAGNESLLTSPVSVTTLAPIEIIIDEESCSYTGSWTAGTATSGAYNNDYKYATTASSETATAIWRPTITTAGLYDVYAMYREGANRTTAAPYTVYYNGGSLSIAVNQESNGGTWVPLASGVPLLAGTAGYVKLGNQTADTGQAVIADAIRFVFADSLPGVPDTPSDGIPLATSSTAITWKWNDVATETGYRVKDTGSSNISGDLAVNTLQWTENVLAPNTKYTRRVYAFNTYGESTGSTGQSAYTLARAGESADGTGSTGNIYCTSASKSTWYPGSKSFAFSNPAGFGTGGTWKASSFEYKWNTDISEAWSTAGTTWASGTISLNPSGSGSYYLHVRAKNGDGIANNTDIVNYGPFRVDATAPSTVSVSDEGSYTPSQSTLKASWTASSDSNSGLDHYEYAVGTSGSIQNTRGWTPNGTSTSVTATGLTLSDGQTYYVQARAIDAVGNASAGAAANGILVAPGAARISDAWAKADATDPLSLRSKTVIYSSPTEFCLEENNGSSGIRVVSTANPGKGNLASVAGVLGLYGPQRVLNGDVVIATTANESVPVVAMNCRYLGGARYNAATPGVANGTGLYNIGLLVRICGRISFFDNTTDPANKYCYIDDGSGLSSDGHPGVRVKCGSINAPTGGYATMTGILRSESIGGIAVPVVVIRDVNDINAF